MFRTLLLGLILAAFGAVACEPPPAVTRSSSRSKSSSSKDDAAEEDATSDDDNGVGTATEATTETPATEPAKPAPAPPVNVFASGTAFAAGATATESAKHHLKTSNAGKDCMGCHDVGGGAPTFAFAGTIYQSKNGAAAPGAQVRIVDAKGTEIGNATSDSSGNFWFPSNTPLPAGARVGVRDGTSTKTMSGAISTGGCNQGGCHAKDRPIYLAD